MSGAAPHQRGSAPNAVVVLAFAAVAFVAFTIAGLGLLSLALDADVIEQPGLGAVPGVVGIAAALAAWLAVMLPAVRRKAGAAAALLGGLSAGAAYTAAIFVGALGVGLDPAAAAAVAARLVTAGFSAIVVLAGLLAGVGAAVAVRAADRPHWPWEKRDSGGPTDE